LTSNLYSLVPNLIGPSIFFKYLLLILYLCSKIVREAVASKSVNKLVNKLVDVYILKVMLNLL
jgi:hypothetical protein